MKLLGQWGREKPPGLTMAEFGEVKAARRSSGGQLTVGFTRRWSPAVRIMRALDQMRWPKFLVYWLAAGPVPDGHWFTDRWQGGRLPDEVCQEVCQFVDTAQERIGAEHRRDRLFSGAQ